MKNEHYEIALLNADRYEALARRAEDANDQELASFFRFMRDEGRRKAKGAMRGIARRVVW